MSKSSHLPPVPLANQSPKGPANKSTVDPNDTPPGRENFAEQGRHGNILQNTTNQGYQQDR
jgi:hypothetical protein